VSLKNHFKFNIGEAKQLGIALISSYGMWAATGFQKSITGLLYPVMGFITGGLASHSSSSSPNVLPDSHIQTPYVNNINDGNPGTPDQFPEVKVYKPEGVDVKKVIEINSGVIKSVD
jgi:hypothetical protein